MTKNLLKKKKIYIFSKSNKSVQLFLTTLQGKEIIPKGGALLGSQGKALHSSA